MGLGIPEALLISGLTSAAASAIPRRVTSTQNVVQPSTMDPMHPGISPLIAGQAISGMQKFGQGGGWGGSPLFGFNPTVGGVSQYDTILKALMNEFPAIIANLFGSSSSAKRPERREPRYEGKR